MKDVTHCVHPSIFWFWNEDPTRDSIARRLDAFLDRGFKSVHIHPMPDNFRPHDFHGGMRIDYLSPAFFDLITIACEEMRQRDMAMWLYDEGGWPSGRAGGLLVREDSGFAARGLRKQLGQITTIDYAQECDYPDLMNVKATQRFIELTHERYRAAIGEEFGKTVKGVFTDEPRILGQIGTDLIPWSPTLPEAFEFQHGYPLDRIIDLLFEVDAVDEATHRARRDFQRTLSDQIGRCFFDPIREWCDRNNLLFEGHHTGDDDFARHGQYFGHYLDQAGRYHLPGVDAIWRQVFPGEPFRNYISLAASSAWLNGNRIAMSEVFAAYGQGLTLEQMRWISGQHLIRGVNRLILMASLESSRAARRLGTCTDFSPSDLRWQDLDLYVQHIERAARFTLRGTPIFNVAMYYRSEQLSDGQAEIFSQQHECMADTILDHFHPLVFVGESDLPCAIETLGIGELIVHASGPLDPSEVEALNSAERAGIKVQYVADAAKLCVPQSEVMLPLSAANGIRALPLRRDDGEVDLMLFNESGEAADLCFRWNAQPLAEHRLEDDVALSTRPLGYEDGVCRVKILPGEIRAFEACDAWPQTPQWILRDSHALADGWQVQVIERLLLDEEVHIEKVADAPKAVDIAGPGAMSDNFSGSLLYSCEIKTRIDPTLRYILDLGEVYDSCELMLGGKSVCRRAWSPWQIDITDALHRGIRDLSLRVTNNAAAAWMNPDVHERDLINHPNPYLIRAAPFMAESLRIGLAGPVRLLAYGTPSLMTCPLKPGPIL